jgi:hypothetical protein
MFSVIEEATKGCDSFHLLTRHDGPGILGFCEIFAISRGAEIMAKKIFEALKRVAAIFVLIAAPVLAYGQQGGPPQAPKPTKADVQKVVQIISSDKAKVQSYCDLKKLYDQMGAAYQKNDSKTADALGKKADALAGKLGPEYSKMMDGLAEVDQNSTEGKGYESILSGLDKLCTGPAQAQSVQPAPVAPAQSAPGQSAPVQPAPAQPAPAQSAPVQSAPVQAAPKGPCAQIRAACTQAGFVANGAAMGAGIVVDCIRPIMAGTPQRKRATKPLPQVDPQVVVACKNQNPNFGMGGAARGPAGQNPSGTMEGPGQ